MFLRDGYFFCTLSRNRVLRDLPASKQGSRPAGERRGGKRSHKIHRLSYDAALNHIQNTNNPTRLQLIETLDV